MLLSAVWALKGPAARRQTFALPLLSLPLSLSLAIPRSASFPSEALECCDEVLDVRHILEVEGLVVSVLVLDAVNREPSAIEEHFSGLRLHHVPEAGEISRICGAPEEVLAQSLG
jgi:hypothetical protein